MRVPQGLQWPLNSWPLKVERMTHFKIGPEILTPLGRSILDLIWLQVHKYLAALIQKSLNEFSIISFVNNALQLSKILVCLLN